jgi:hypothetical protein
MVAAVCAAPALAVENRPRTTSQPVDIDEPRIAWRFGSTKNQVPLLEVYTSQECNSCPPVERFLSDLPKNGAGFDRVVPLAYHVSYWPHLGWTDPFAQSDFAERHRIFVELQRESSPYTPEAMLNGHERRERGTALLDAIDEVNQRTPPVRLEMLVEMPQRSRRTLEVYGQADRSTVRTLEPEPAIIWTVIFEMGLSTNVTAGENKGKTLNCDYVVRKLGSRHELKPVDDVLEFGAILPLDKSWNVDRLGLAAFIQLKATGRVIQATGALLDPKTAKPADP